MIIIKYVKGCAGVSFEMPAPRAAIQVPALRCSPLCARACSWRTRSASARSRTRRSSRRSSASRTSAGTARVRRTRFQSVTGVVKYGVRFHLACSQIRFCNWFHSGRPKDAVVSGYGSGTGSARLLTVVYRPSDHQKRRFHSTLRRCRCRTTTSTPATSSRPLRAC